MPTDPDGPEVVWYRFPYSHDGEPWLAEPLDEYSQPIPKHCPTAEEISLVKRLGINPRSPNFSKLRAKLLRRNLRAADLPALSVEDILAVLDDDKPSGTKKKKKTGPKKARYNIAEDCKICKQWDDGYANGSGRFKVYQDCDNAHGYQPGTTAAAVARHRGRQRRAN